MSPATRAISRYWFIILLGMLFVGTGLLRLNDLCLYTPDSSRYVIWGNAIARGDGFVDATQPDADRVVVHAPLYSVLIAPVELVFPLSLTAVKVATLMWGALALLLLYLLLSRLRGEFEAGIAAVLLVCNPLFLLYSTEALSEAPFIALVLAVMLLCEAQIPKCDKPGQMILLTVLVACAPLLREVGIALVLAVTIYLVSHRQFKWGATVLLAAAVLSGLWIVRNQFWVGSTPGSQSGNLSLLVQHFATSPGGSMTVELLVRMWLNIKRYALQLGGMMFYPLFSTHQVNLVTDPSWMYEALRDVFSVVKFVIAVVVGPLMAMGVYRDARASASWGLRFMFASAYLAAILLYPINDIRFLVPLVPFMIYYAIVGTARLAEFLSDDLLFAVRKWGLAIPAVLMLPNLVAIQQIVATNRAYVSDPVGMADRLRVTNAYPPMFTQPWNTIGAWIREHVQAGEIIATPSKELATVIGDRYALELDPGVPLPMFESLLRDNGAGYLLSPVRWSDFSVYEFHMAESRRLLFQEVHAVGNLHLFKISSRITAPDSLRTAGHRPDDTTSVTGLLRRGRRALVRGDRATALKDLSRAYALAPLQPDVVYQAIVASAFAGDSARAVELYHTLMTLPQTGTYLFLSRVQLEIMGKVQAAARARQPEERVVTMFTAASEYWKLGYGGEAYRIMNQVVQIDTQYLNGLLWALHFSLQQGDTARARTDLGYLKNIDATNPVVLAFGKVFDLADSLDTTTRSRRRSQLQLAIAKIYRDIELKEESIDEAMKAIREDAGNTQAIMFVGESFERKSRPRVAGAFYSEVARRDPSNLIARARADSLRVIRGSL